MKEATENTLYAAATEALVSETSGNSVFEKMIAVAYAHSSVEKLQKEIRETEKIIKKEYELSSMPSPWRSSKSVILSAMTLGIALIDDNGNYCGKTNLQMKIKAAKTTSKEPVTSNEYINKILALLTGVPPHLDKYEIYAAVGTFIKDF